MTYLFYTAVCVVLIVIQTVFMQYMPLFDRFFDLLVPFVVYLGLFRSPRESLPVIICLGFVLDNISAAPFGLYLTGYIWIYAGVKWMIRFLHVRTSLLIFFVVALAVLLEDLLLLLSMSMSGQLPPAESASRKIFMQVFWALVTGPIFLIGFEFLHSRVEGWVREHRPEKNGMM
jgi:cell shape-determining protein MreD